jgi:glycogen debranching enzyme
VDDVIRIEDRFYIAAGSSLAEAATEVLKRGDTFLVVDHHGNVRPLGIEEHGLFHEGTRFLSRYQLTVEGRRPLLLSSAVSLDNRTLAVDLTNPEFEMADGTSVRQGNLHINRFIFLGTDSFHDNVRVTNFSQTPVSFTLGLDFEADFADIFEVRGLQRDRRGTPLEPKVSNGRAIITYLGLDGLKRSTHIDVRPLPARMDSTKAAFKIRLGPREDMHIGLVASCLGEDVPREDVVFGQALEESRALDEARRQLTCKIETSNEQFNDWLNRSLADTLMMLTDTPHGLYPYAGIPWFSTVFGRDGIITALETLWVCPDIARGVLTYLAANQAEAKNEEQEAEPGKILHEVRKGEMARLKEIPFGYYYGTADATPLFVVLAGRYFEATGDREFVALLWPNIERALTWIDEYGDVDGDGFVEYIKHSPTGLINQGWKDSFDSIFHADGEMAHGAIALCEVQAYVYEAKLSASRIAEVLGDSERARQLDLQARELKERFLRKFWSPELGSYAIALDGDKNPCLVRSSNAGHCLYSGIAAEEHAASLVSVLMADASFSGWGVRTVAAGEAHYNPMSYHNGSVWPHDNAMIAAGLARYGFKDEAQRILAGLFDASIFIYLNRLPELFCGFHRRPGEGPTLYPVACAPQAWAAGVVFMLLQASLGLSVSGLENRLQFDHPRLPPFLEEVKLSGLRVGRGSVDLAVRRRDDDVTVNVLKRSGGPGVTIIK